MALVVLLMHSVPVRGAQHAPSWPPFLPVRESFSPDTVAAVDRVWVEPTLTRTVKGRTAQVPFEVLIAFVDAPEVTAAAARFRKLARYEVQMMEDGWYRAEDHDGARGTYRVLVREPRRRVILSRGEHSGRILGTITGSALTVVDFEPNSGGVDQRLTAYVRIDNAVAAALARLIVWAFGFIADRKLAEGLAVTGQVAEWAVEQPAEFCRWLAREPLGAGQRERLNSALPGCPE
jgi:hypothetical protein